MGLSFLLCRLLASQSCLAYKHWEAAGLLAMCAREQAPLCPVVGGSIAAQRCRAKGWLRSLFRACQGAGALPIL